jgi:hypothetical protein
MAGHQIKSLGTDPIEHLDSELSIALSRHESLSGCFTIYGPIQICYTVEGGGFKVCL